MIEIFSKSNDTDEIRTALDSLNLSLQHETILSVLRNLDGRPDIATRFFNWVSETESGKLSSKSYNLMLKILGRKEHLKEFWELFGTMKKKGYGISKNTFIKVSENFGNEGLASDSDRLSKKYHSKPAVDSAERRMCANVCKVIREDEWGERVIIKLEEMDIGFSSDLVSMVLEHLDIYPMKALMFFRWVEGKQSFEHNDRTYNSMARVLGREDSIVDFWSIVNEMKNAGWKMEMEVYVKVSSRFFKRKMMKDAVDLYEFMTSSGSEKPPAQDCLFLLRKIMTGNDPVMDLISRVLRVFTENGNTISKSLFDGVFRSLIGAAKFWECEKIFKAMEAFGFVANSDVYSQVVYSLCKARKLDEAYGFLDNLESAGHDPDPRIWVSLIRGHCFVGEMDKASSCFRKMVDRNGVTGAGHVFEALVVGFCEKNKATDAFKLLVEMVNDKQLQPSCASYKILIEKLMARGHLKEASSLLKLMKSDGFPPFVDPFINYFAKSGTGDDALTFVKEITGKRALSTSVFLRIFEAFFKAGKHDVAQDFLSKSPSYIQNHADVLNLFCNKAGETAAVAIA